MILPPHPRRQLQQTRMDSVHPWHQKPHYHAYRSKKHQQPRLPLQHQIRILTDNGFEFSSRSEKSRENHSFKRMLIEIGVKHRYIRPYRPQTNGKVEVILANPLWRLHRRHHLRKTKTNLEKNYTNIWFIIMNTDSTKPSEDWLQKNFMRKIYHRISWSLHLKKS